MQRFCCCCFVVAEYSRSRVCKIGGIGRRISAKCYTATRTRTRTHTHIYIRIYLTAIAETENVYFTGAHILTALLTIYYPCKCVCVSSAIMASNTFVVVSMPPASILYSLAAISFGCLAFGLFAQLFLVFGHFGCFASTNCHIGRFLLFLLLLVTEAALAVVYANLRLTKAKVCGVH